MSPQSRLGVWCSSRRSGESPVCAFLRRRASRRRANQPSLDSDIGTTLRLRRELVTPWLGGSDQPALHYREAVPGLLPAQARLGFKPRAARLVARLRAHAAVAEDAVADARLRSLELQGAEQH